MAGFEIESELGRGPRGAVYVATQTGLGRRVALKLYPGASAGGGRDGVTAPWPEHPGVARLHAAGTAAEGSFTASQLAAGGSLAARLAAGDIAREQALALCDEAAATLAAIGVAHGALGAGNVLIDADGRALLCDFGMPGVQASAEADRRALAALRAQCGRLPSRVSAARRRRGSLVGAAAAAAAAAVVVAVLAGGGEGERPHAAVPAPLPGTTVLGSSLTGAPATTLGCDGGPPNGSQPACSIMPLRRAGRSLAFPADGVIRRWAVRGARGSVTLQVARPAGSGRFVTRAIAQTERATDPGVRAFATDVPVRRGDLAALALAPGAGIGVPRRATGGDAASRFVGALNYQPPRAAGGPAGSALDRGIELRVEYIAGGRPRPVPALSGAAARAAPPGRVLAEGEEEFPGIRVRTLRVVALPGTVALDLLRGGTRLQRVTVVGADPRGTLTELVREAFLAPGAGVVWRNPDGREIRHHYRASATRLTVID